jgi:hypothetical protein
VIEGRALKLLDLGGRQPMLGRLFHGQASAFRGMGTFRYVDSHLGVMGIRIFLAHERLDVSLAALVNIIDDPSLLGFTSARDPFSFAD